jgi:hypothetical protein
MSIRFEFYIFMFLLIIFSVNSIKSSENVSIIKHVSYYIRALNKQKTHYIGVTFYTFDGNEIIKLTLGLLGILYAIHKLGNTYEIQKE